MDKKQVELLSTKLRLALSEDKIKAFEKYSESFLEKNAITNLISKNDEKFLFEKHIFDSLAINLFFKNHNLAGKKLLDIGTGGGFPSVPISIIYDNLEVFAIDSIRKKIKVIEDLKADLKLKNLTPICDRVENCKNKFDYITTRAVAPVDKILQYATPKLKDGGYFIAYKSKRASDELKDAQKTIKKFNLKIVETIEYTLPFDEIYERNLIIFRK